MKKLHYISGVVLSVFIGLHLFNHLVSVIGVQTHIEVMNQFRLIYRNVIVEFIILSAVLIQIISGIKLFLSRRKLKLDAFQKLQLWSGLYLAMFFMIHVSAVLAGRFILELDTNFYFGAAGLNTFPINLFFIPYYALAIFAFFGHIAAIHAQKMRKNILGISPFGQSNIILIIGIVITMVILYGLTNGFSGIEVPEEYGVLIGK